MKHGFHNDNLDHFFKVEIENEQHGGIAPATIESAIDSLTQAPNDVIESWLDGDAVSGLVALARLLTVLPATTELRDVVSEGE